MSVDIKRLTAHLSPPQQAAVRKIYRERAENSTAAFISCFFLGVFGAHRFYLKQWQRGFMHLFLAAVIALVVAGGFLVHLPVVTVAIVAGILLLLALFWVIVDLVRIDDEVASHNIKLAEMLIAQTLFADRTVEQQANAKLESMLHETAAQADAAANYGRMQVGELTGALAETPSPNDTVAAAPIPAVGAVTAQYVADTVTQISDDPNATQHSSKKAPESSVERDTVSDVPAGAALAGAALAPLVSEVVTHTHEVAGYSVTDGVETMTTASIPEQQQPASAVFESEALPTEDEANAVTWPGRARMALNEPPASPRWIAPDVTDQGEIDGDARPVADIVPVGALPLHVALDDASGIAAAGAQDETGIGIGAGAGLGAAAFAAAPLVAESVAAHSSEAGAEPSVAAAEPAEAVFTPADEGLLVFEPEETPVASQSFETPAEAYIPPLVPIVATTEAYDEPAVFATEPEPIAAQPVPAAYEAALEPLPTAHEPSASLESEPTASAMPATEPEQHTHTGGETLAELGALAGLAGLAGLATSAADEAVSLARAHRESLAAIESKPASAYDAQPETPAEPAYEATPVEQSAEQPETLAEVATSPTPAEEATSEPAPEAAGAEPDREAVPVAATAAGLAAATDAELLVHHKLKRIRVVRQLKVDGKVVEENVAEEYIDPDADPEPVKARLREQLRQQAQERSATQGETNG